MRIRPCAAALAVAFSAPLAGASELAAITKPELRTLSVRAFALDREQEVRIEGVTADVRSSWSPARIWLLDAASRKSVWDVVDATLARPRHGLAPFEATVHLPTGEYELYLATFPGVSGRGDRHGVDVHELIGRLQEFMDLDGLEDVVTQLEVRVTGEGSTRAGDAAAVRERLARGAAAAVLGVGDDADGSAGFAMRAPASVRVVCYGEVFSDGAYDGGWIEDADTGAQVWRFDERDSDKAGGAGKNRVVHAIVRLPAGRYVARFATDGSHSSAEFNAPPPDDPFAWGIVVRPAGAEDAGSVEPFAAADARPRNLIAALTEVRDGEHRSAGFTLHRPLAVRVIAVGEGTRGEMNDLGWIVDARTHATVWEMDYDHTEHAGGSGKNRIEEKILQLPAGSYVAHFATDGSHAFGDWNAAPPLARRRWGMTVVAADRSFTPEDVAPFDADAATPGLARISRVRSDQERNATFTLDRDADVEIYALGESDGRDMADYGWIETVGTGKTVWEMRYSDTEHAGGSKKNRAFRGTVHLPAGEYRLRYESDGSHAYGDWNADPPRDPDAWGITVTLAAGRLPAEAAPGR
jgi:hypothetical protein